METFWESLLSVLGTAVSSVAGVVVAGIAFLDALPESMRALLTALLLVLLLTRFDRRIPGNEHPLRLLFRKTALVTLLVVPLLVWLFPSTRMAVLVEVLPAQREDIWLGWQVLVGIWLAGAAVSLGMLGWRLVQSARAVRDLEVLPADDALVARTAHWSQRLALQRVPELRLIGGGEL